MIKKFTSGNPIDTQAVVEKFNALPIAEFPLGGKFENGNFVFEFDMADSDIVYGLGEAPRGINKRGWVYNSFCSDDPFHTETKSSLYAAHNFLMLSGSKTFGIFIDFPSKIRWDIGYTTTNKTVITIDGTDFDIYYIDGTKPLEIVKEFRKSIGTSYVPPFWAFGYQQSRWSYYNAEAVDAVVDGYNKAGIPLDCVYLDIDYMERYKDFTVDDEKFPNFKDYVSKKREEGIHLIPIIDAGVKKENGYDIYEEGRKNGYFCKNEDGTDFEGGVWPGIVAVIHNRQCISHRFSAFLADSHVKVSFRTQHFRHLDLRLQNRLTVGHKYRSNAVHTDRQIIDCLRMRLQQADMQINIRSHFRCNLEGEFRISLIGHFGVSFDKVVEVMKQTGHDLPSLYKETSEGGLAKDYQQME